MVRFAGRKLRPHSKPESVAEGNPIGKVAAERGEQSQVQLRGQTFETLKKDAAGIRAVESLPAEDGR